MIEITIPDTEYYDESTNTFYPTPGGTFRFEHCLKAIRKWEGIFKIPFLDIESNSLTHQQLMTYYMCMELDDKIQSYHLTDEVVRRLHKRLSEKPTATVISSRGDDAANRSSFTTSEVIYAMMAQSGIPFSCEEWNIHNLMMTLRIISVQSGEKESMSQEEILRQNTDLNKKRRAQMNSRG